MKLRIKANTVRFRVSPSEVQQLLHSGSVRQVTRFAVGAATAANTLEYVLEFADGLQAVECSYQPSCVRVRVPRAMATAWAEGEQVGIYAKLPLGATEELEISIEKDFACLDRDEEQNADTFPRAGAVC